MVRTPPAGTPAAPTLEAVAVTLGGGTEDESLTQTMVWAQKNANYGSYGLETKNPTTLSRREVIRSLRVMNSHCRFPNETSPSHGETRFVRFSEGNHTCTKPLEFRHRPRDEEKNSALTES